MTVLERHYLFYDIETTGLNPCFDQVLQFAAIRTDLELREIERYEINVKLNCDVIPSPKAILTHRIGFSQSQQGEPEITAIQKIHRLLNTPGTISLGYNTLGFDDEFLRFNFYRNLLPPYTHQYANGCSRMDLFPMTLMYFLYKRNVLPHWPKQDQKISLKLEHLSSANQLATGAAHNAMVDVEATVALAKKFIQERQMWEYLTSCFNKETDAHRTSQLTEALLVDGKLGYRYAYQAPVLLLGEHKYYQKQSVWLRLDLENLMQTCDNNIPETTYAIRKKPGEKEFLLPMKSRFLAMFNVQRRHIAEANKIWLTQNPSLLKAISDYHCHFVYPKVANVDANAALYDMAFPTRTQENLFERFHTVSPEKKMSVAQQFANPTHRELALRIMGRHYSQFLTAEECHQFNQYLTQAVVSIDYRGQPKLSIAAAREEVVALSSEPLDQQQRQLLEELTERLNLGV